MQTVNHVVYLNGFVDEGLQSRTAESVAFEAPGVTRVVNSIAVTPLAEEHTAEALEVSSDRGGAPRSRAAVANAT